MTEEKKFKPGDVVYHKASEKRGVLVRHLEEDKWEVSWDESNKEFNRETELYTKKEYDDKYGPGFTTA